eukprot:6165920-Pleurochrysis_carterae.AAC.1
MTVKLERKRYREARTRATTVVARPRAVRAARSRACVAAAVCGSAKMNNIKTTKQGNLACDSNLGYSIISAD